MSFADSLLLAGTATPLISDKCKGWKEYFLFVKIKELENAGYNVYIFDLRHIRVGPCDGRESVRVGESIRASMRFGCVEIAYYEGRVGGIADMSVAELEKIMAPMKRALAK